jgi:hypothetical protein
MKRIFMLDQRQSNFADTKNKNDIITEKENMKEVRMRFEAIVEDQNHIG